MINTMNVFLVLSGSILLNFVLATEYIPLQCGIQPIGSEELAEKETDTILGEFPWHTAIYHISHDSIIYVCGGTMIDERFILTSGHCVFNLDSGEIMANTLMVVRLGVHSLDAPFQLTSQQYSVGEIHIHPNFTFGHPKHDIAILMLSMVVRFSDYVHPVCVDQTGESENGYGTVVGWGLADVSVSSDLRDVQLPMHSGLLCPEPNEETFCAGYSDGTNVCNGDIGGGIFIKRGKAWTLVGVLSKPKNTIINNDTCQINGYATFTKVHTFLPWIEMTTRLQLKDESDEFKFTAPTGTPAKSCEAKEFDITKWYTNYLPEECGSYVVNRIVRGQKANLSEFPWMAIVRYLIAPIHELDNLCAGTLISKRYVLTAAHCVKESKRPYQVRLGEYIIGQERDCDPNDKRDCAPPVRDYGIECIIRHQNYNRRTKQNNIALLRLDRDVTFEDHISPICLPVLLQLKTMQPYRYIITGWGDREDESKSMTLLKATVKPANQSECQEWMNLKGLKLSQNQLCVGKPDGPDACRGDGGGPLGYSAWYNGMRFVQFGIVSFGFGCGVVPAVYTKLADYMDWIVANMKP
ncbi:transmembrane protease serine 9-like [Ochlerotatus camptorhynchus]|uniref:transmembrane protease serine 9-like n=1 Tax=Ochlerotatus camptorhynchus TaxID=644619 RepID=UPI0031D62B30